MVLLAIDLHLCASWYDLHHATGAAPRSMVPPPWSSFSITIYLMDIYTARRPYKEKLQPYGSCRLFTTNLISYNNFVIMTISHHMPCKNKLDASKLSLQILRGFGLPRKEPILPTDKNHNVDSLVVSFRLRETDTPKPLYTVQAVCQV